MSAMIDESSKLQSHIAELTEQIHEKCGALIDGIQPTFKIDY